MCRITGMPMTRRQAVQALGAGFGFVALSNMVGSSLQAADAVSRGVVKDLHFTPKAKRVIFLFMNGGVSHVDTFDPKPALEKYHGQPTPGGPILTQRKTGNLMKSPFAFTKHGQSGIEMSELWPHLGTVADDITVIRSMWCDIPNHEPSLTMWNTGANFLGRPSLGSWITYGRGARLITGPVTFGSWTAWVHLERIDVVGSEVRVFAGLQHSLLLLPF